MTVANREDQTRRLIYELQLMQGTADTLQQRLAILQNALADLRVAEESLKALSETEEGSPILIPMGGGTLVNAQLGDTSKVIINIGAEVSIDMPLEDAQKNVADRLENVEKTNTSVEQQLQQLLAQMEVHRDGINRLSAQIRGEAQGV
ncbi:prefoldin subunit alpha [Candidatus Bathyarchaeota archaeon]|nr:prefoldin subunit alpha [Candidatus Bathyarchaeota archaeon]MBL7167831.1 prefoldin subunit alpha [Candidatus Bathyarchaeota archaeon]